MVRDVAQALTRRKLALSKDIYGRSPLHMAVLLELKDIAEYIVKRVPITVKCRDNVSLQTFNLLSPFLGVVWGFVHLLVTNDYVSKNFRDQ